MRRVGFSGMLQPSATHPHFGQTCLFTNSLKFGTTNCGWNVWGRKVGRTFQNDFSKHFSRAWVLDLGYKSLKSASKTHSEKFVLPKSSFGEHKLVTKDHSIPENQHIASHVATIFCNHLANFMLPKRRFWKAEPTFQNASSKHFSRVSKILERWTKDEIRIFDWLFNGS